MALQFLWAMMLAFSLKMTALAHYVNMFIGYFGLFLEFSLEFLGSEGFLVLHVFVFCFLDQLSTILYVFQRHFTWF